MGRIFKIGLESLGWQQNLLALKIPILSKNKILKKSENQQKALDGYHRIQPK